MKKDLRKIVWLASYPKSGNTWFRVFLSNLLSEKEEPVSINELYATPIASSRSLFDNIAGVSGSDLTQDEIEELRPEVYRQIAREAEETVFHKVHDAWRLTPSGKPMFPAEVTKGVIYFIRNPLDVTVSFAFHGSKSPGRMISQINNKNNAFCQKNDRIYNQLLQPLSDWSGHVRSWVDDSGLPVMVLRYEDMLNDTFNSFKRALEFIGLEKSDQEISKAIEASTIEKLSAMEKREGFSEKPLGMKAFFREGRAESWKQHLVKEEIDTLINSQHTFIERFGYLK
ncbi:MAG: sulfotransferase domain-containing protein [Bacteroidales bacterium]|nr:sulfotransferase domain-containing protein [Bacteroidales bacterium]